MGNNPSTDTGSDHLKDIQPYQGHGPDSKRCRNQLKERLSAGLIIPCVYAQQGCQFKSDRTRVEVHERNCEFNPNILKLCHFLGYICDYMSNLTCSRSSIEHFLKNHDAILQTGDSVVLQFDDLKTVVEKCFEKVENGNFARWKPVILRKSEACKFIILAKVVVKKQLRMFTLKCVQLNGEVANIKYEAEYYVMSPSLRVRSIKWKEPTQKFLDFKRLQAGNVLDLDDLEELYTDKKGTMNIKVRILRRGMDASFTPNVTTKVETGVSEVVLGELLKM